MRASPLPFGALGLALAIAFALAACKDCDAPSGGGGAPSPSTVAAAKVAAKRLPNGQCPPPGSTCTAGEYERYAACVDEKCDDANKQCLGPGYQSGTFDGPCKDYMTCTFACACDDTACIQKCPPVPACRACLGRTVLPCVQRSTCEAPACAAP